MKTAIDLLKEFADWYEDACNDDLSGYDQDTTPYAVWEFLSQAAQPAVETEDISFHQCVVDKW